MGWRIEGFWCWGCAPVGLRALEGLEGLGGWRCTLVRFSCVCTISELRRILGLRGENWIFDMRFDDISVNAGNVILWERIWTYPVGTGEEKDDWGR